MEHYFGRCPACGWVLVGYCPGEPDARPQAGDLFECHCGAVLVARWVN